jgi:dephospho-CoA kinase
VLTVGLTGGIACGKSVVRRRLDERGVRTLDADLVVHDLMKPGTDVSGEIAARVGPEVIARDGSVDRKALGAVVFRDEAEREGLEAIVHPRVFEAIESFFADARAEGERLAVVDAALMVETGSYERYDRLVVVYCPRDLQKERLMSRDGLSPEEADRRIEAQMPVEEKKELADYVIDTSSTVDETLRRTDEVLEQLLAEGQATED